MLSAQNSMSPGSLGHHFTHTKCRYAAKLDSEGAAMYDAAKALKQAMIELGVACDGGKDSLSMAANVAGEVC